MHVRICPYPPFAAVEPDASTGSYELVTSIDATEVMLAVGVCGEFGFEKKLTLMTDRNPEF